MKKLRCSAIKQRSVGQKKQPLNNVNKSDNGSSQSLSKVNKSSLESECEMNKNSQKFSGRKGPQKFVKRKKGQNSATQSDNNSGNSLSSSLPPISYSLPLLRSSKRKKSSKYSKGDEESSIESPQNSVLRRKKVFSSTQIECRNVDDNDSATTVGENSSGPVSHSLPTVNNSSKKRKACKRNQNSKKREKKSGNSHKNVKKKNDSKVLNSKEMKLNETIGDKTNSVDFSLPVQCSNKENSTDDMDELSFLLCPSPERENGDLNGTFSTIDPGSDSEFEALLLDSPNILGDSGSEKCKKRLELFNAIRKGIRKLLQFCSKIDNKILWFVCRIG